MLTFSPGPGRSKSKKAIKITWHFQVWALNQPGAAPPLINDCSQLWILGCCRTHISINTLCTLGTNILFDINLKTKLKSRSSDVIYGDPIVMDASESSVFYPSLVRSEDFPKSSISCIPSSIYCRAKDAKYEFFLHAKYLFNLNSNKYYGYYMHYYDAYWEHYMMIHIL